MESKLRGLFINNKKAKDSIYESGYMAYQCLLLSEKYELDYVEVDAENRNIATGYDFYFFNYHILTMKWLDTANLKKELGFCITIVLEVAPNDPFIMCPDTDFDVYVTLDPTVKVKNKKVYPFPRPLEKINFELPVVRNEIPVIGTFGFSTKGKGFEKVVEAVNKEFDKAIIRINIPYGDFVPKSEEYAKLLGNNCKQLAKDGIEVIVTHDFLSKDELIKWCASNTLNCFLYDRNMPGLAATTDQAIASGQPLSVSDNNTFRHITAYLPPYPKFSLKDSIEKSKPVIKQIQNDWQPENFMRKFEAVIDEHKNKIIKTDKGVPVIYQLPLKEDNLLNTLKSRIRKYKHRFKKNIIGL